MPAGVLRDAYPNRWTASETTFGEDKATITGAGKRTCWPRPPLRLPAARRAGSLVLASPAPSWSARARPPLLRSEEAAARALRRADE